MHRTLPAVTSVIRFTSPVSSERQVSGVAIIRTIGSASSGAGDPKSARTSSWYPFADCTTSPATAPDIEGQHPAMSRGKASPPPLTRAAMAFATSVTSV